MSAKGSGVFRRVPRHLLAPKVVESVSSATNAEVDKAKNNSEATDSQFDEKHPAKPDEERPADVKIKIVTPTTEIEVEDGADEEEEYEGREAEFEGKKKKDLDPEKANAGVEFNIVTEEAGEEGGGYFPTNQEPLSPSADLQQQQSFQLLPGDNSNSDTPPDTEVMDTGRKVQELLMSSSLLDPPEPLENEGKKYLFIS